MIEEKHLAVLRMMHDELGSWKEVGKALGMAERTLYRYRKERIVRPKRLGLIEAQQARYKERGDRAIRQKPTIAKVEQMAIKREGVGYYGYVEKTPSLNKQYGILMDVLKDKVADEDIRSDIANNIERMEKTRFRLVTNAELFDNMGQEAAVLTFRGMLPKDTRHILKRFKGMLSLSAAFESFKKQGIAKGMFQSASIRKITAKTPVKITRIRLNFNFA